jgi:hypothetical protein
MSPLINFTRSPWPPLPNSTMRRIERIWTRADVIPPDEDNGEEIIRRYRPPGNGWIVFERSREQTGWIRSVKIDDDDEGER